MPRLIWVFAGRAITLLVLSCRGSDVCFKFWCRERCFGCFLSAGDKTLDGYQKKKYVCKLLFIFLLGHDIDFGHMEAVNLLSSNKYTEKQIVSWPNIRETDYKKLPWVWGVNRKICPRVTVWHHEALPMNAKQDHEGRIFLSAPNNHDR